MTIPTVQQYMTASPHTIGQEQPLTQAHKVLREHKIRHLPVLHGGKMVGMVTERDLALVEALPGIDPDHVTVEEAMSGWTFSVAPDTPLDEVVAEMAKQKYGSAIVVEGGKPVGIFTAVDVCRAFAETLKNQE